MRVSRQFIKWIKTYLEDEEMYILLNHIEMDTMGKFTLKNTHRAKKKMARGRYQLRMVRDKLEALAILYELLVIAFPQQFDA